MSDSERTSERRASIQSLLPRVLLTFVLLCLTRLLMILPVFGTRVRELGLYREVEGIPSLMRYTQDLEVLVSFGALGLAPYLSVCLLLQVAIPIIPPLRELARKGKDFTLQVIIWIGTGVFSFYSIRQLVWIMNEPLFDYHLLALLQIVLGVFLLVAIGHAITKWGIGNGIALILATQTVAQLPQALNAFRELLGPALPGAKVSNSLIENGPDLFQLLVLYPVVFIVAVGASVAFFTAHRRLMVTYEDGERPAVFPMPLWFVGILPLVTAQAWLLFVPALLRIIGFRLNVAPLRDFVYSFSMESPAYTMVFALLLVVFSIWWSRWVFDHTHVATTLAETGGRIDGVQPGPETAVFLRKTMTRLSIAGGFFLMVLCLLPLFMNMKGKIPFVLAQFTGGLSILILVAVFLDTFKQFKAARS